MSGVSVERWNGGTVVAQVSLSLLPGLLIVLLAWQRGRAKRHYHGIFTIETG